MTVLRQPPSILRKVVAISSSFIAVPKSMPPKLKATGMQGNSSSARPSVPPGSAHQHQTTCQKPTSDYHRGWQSDYHHPTIKDLTTSKTNRRNRTQGIIQTCEEWLRGERVHPVSGARASGTTMASRFRGETVESVPI